ncbi:hypothetical protein DPMN_171224 [Dreissena polymorpha]|uniref:Uncharacterized protein n=2 Tax=Dreissena polymorpha TaxID=45954 RepID=A0A9D4E016_DREPO|nr:hypothetical protein DPMN_171224 [Dreissena polymorpha]
MQDSRPSGNKQLRWDQLKQLNYAMTVDETTLTAIVRTNGLHYSDYDSKNSLPKPWQLMKLVESARYMSHHWPMDDTGRTFRDYAELTADRLTFLVTSCFDIRMDLYDLSTPKCPLDVRVQGGFVGSSSLNSSATVITVDGKELLRNINQVVSIDKNTRRPLPLPGWWKEKYQPHGRGFSALKLDKYEKPSSLKPYKVQVARSDIDSNNHTNWSVYVRFALDGLYHNVKHGLVKHFTCLEQRGLSRMELLYSGESFDDDMLNVFVWNDDDNINRVKVHIEKNEVLLFQGSFEYFQEPFH